MHRLMSLLVKLAGLLFVAALLGVAVLAWQGTWFRDVLPTGNDACQTLSLDGSARDIQIDRQRGIAYLSVESGSDDPGTVQMVELNTRPLRARPALASQPAHFRPQGLSLLIDQRGRRDLFVVNRAPGRAADSVERFHQAWTGEFTHEETFTDRSFDSTSDVVAVGPRRFYVVNESAGSSAANLLQQFGIGGSALSYYDNGETRQLIQDIAVGGGMGAAENRNTLYVAETMARRIRVLEREPVTGDVTELRRIALDAAPDSIDVGVDGGLWVAVHPNMLKLRRHLASQIPAPSQVLRIRIRGDAIERDAIFADDGSRIPAGNLAANYRDVLLIGSITAPALLVCRLDETGQLLSVPDRS